MLFPGLTGAPPTATTGGAAGEWELGSEFELVRLRRRPESRFFCSGDPGAFSSFFLKVPSEVEGRPEALRSLPWRILLNVARLVQSCSFSGFSGFSTLSRFSFGSGLPSVLLRRV